MALLVEVLVSLFQVEEDLFSTFGGRSSGDPVVDASQKLLQQGLQLRFVFSRQLRHLYCCSFEGQSRVVGFIGPQCENV